MSNKVKLQSEVNVGVRGYFKIEVAKEDNTITKELSCENIVTDYGIRELLFADSAYVQYTSTARLGIGDGTTERTASSINLGSEIAIGTSRQNMSMSWSSEDNLDNTQLVRVTHSYSYGLGEVVATISEIGLFSTTNYTQNTLMAGQLIKDEFGDPTTVTILSDEQLRVEYTLEFVVPNVEQKVTEATYVIDGVSYLVEMFQNEYASNYTSTGAVNHWSAGTAGTGLYVNTSVIGGGDFSFSLGRSGTVSTGYTKTYSVVVFPSAGDYSTDGIIRFRTRDGNFNTNPSTSLWTHLITFTPGIPKTDEQALYVDWEVTYKFTRA